jgi:hypothetical protein
MFSSLFYALALFQHGDEPVSRPAELLQARSCQADVPGEPVEQWTEEGNLLLSLDIVPACLVPIFSSLGAEASSLAGSEEATAVLHVAVGRAFNTAILLYSAPADRHVHYVDALDPIFDILASEWSDYLSADGDLGWSGFVLVVNGGDIRVRPLASNTSPFAAYEIGTQLEAEFFPAKQLDPGRETIGR